MVTINHRLKIGLDYHGVIDNNHTDFAKFCAVARQRGHLIYIITGGPKSAVEYFLQSQNILYDFIFAISDYYQALSRVELSPDGSFNIPEHLWNIAKADFCRRNHINFHIDDSEAYLHWFSTPFCLYDAKLKKCFISPGIVLDFTLPAEVLIDKLEQLSQNMTSFV